MTDQEKTTELLELVDDLCDTNFSSNSSKIDEWVNNLKIVYANNYRHAYSDIFFKVQQIISDESQPEILEILGENLNVLGRRIDELTVKNSEDANYKNAAFGYKKFADHIKLEIGRYNFIKSRFGDTKQTSERVSNTNISDEDLKQSIQKNLELEKAINDMRPTVTQAQKQLDGLDEKLEKNKISSITTLTIFSAVILAFSGGITFEAGIFQGMASATPYRLVFTIALTGFILFNTIFALLYLVGKMADKRISTKCKYLSKETNGDSNCNVCGDGYCKKECSNVTIACRMIHKYTYVFLINLIIAYVLYTDFFLWLSDGDIFNPCLWLSQLVLGISIIALLIAFYIRKRIRRKRIKLHYKVYLVRDMLGQIDSEYMSVIFRIGEMMSRTFGRKSPSLKEKYLNQTETLSPQAAFEYLDSFLNEELLKEDRLSLFITGSQYKIDKRKWNDLRNSFMNYLEKRNITK